MNFHANVICNLIEKVHKHQGQTYQFFLILTYYYMLFKMALILVLEKRKVFLFSVVKYFEVV